MLASGIIKPLHATGSLTLPFPCIALVLSAPVNSCRPKSAEQSSGPYSFASFVICLFLLPWPVSNNYLELNLCFEHVLAK